MFVNYFSIVLKKKKTPMCPLCYVFLFISLTKEKEEKNPYECFKYFTNNAWKINQNSILKIHTMDGIGKEESSRETKTKHTHTKFEEDIQQNYMQTID